MTRIPTLEFTAEEIGWSGPTGEPHHNIDCFDMCRVLAEDLAPGKLAGIARNSQF